MWRRTYLFLVLVRLWFALSPSYLHPDENFQGPEVIAGKLRSLGSFSFCALVAAPACAAASIALARVCSAAHAEGDFQGLALQLVLLNQSGSYRAALSRFACVTLRDVKAIH
jgi:hypothetical protein